MSDHDLKALMDRIAVWRADEDHDEQESDELLCEAHDLLLARTKALERLSPERTTERYHEPVPASDSPLRPAYTLAMAQLQESRDQWKARAEELAKGYPTERTEKHGDAE